MVVCDCPLLILCSDLKRLLGVVHARTLGISRFCVLIRDVDVGILLDLRFLIHSFVQVVEGSTLIWHVEVPSHPCWSLVVVFSSTQYFVALKQPVVRPRFELLLLYLVM